MRPPSSIYIAFDVFPRPKGSTSHVASMVQAMALEWSPVWLLCLGYGDMPRYQEEGNVRVWRFKEYHPNALRRAAGFAEFVENMMRRAGDSVELTVFRDPWGGCPALEWGHSSANVFEVNALPSWELAYGYPGFSRNPTLAAKVRDMERFCLRESDSILTVSALTAEALAEEGADRQKIKVIPNSASRDFFEAGAADSPIPALEEKRWIGYVGSLHPWQGVNVLLDAFIRVADDVPDLNLLIVHGGRKGPAKTLKKRIRKKAPPGRVLAHPPLSREALGAVIKRLEFTAAPLLENTRNSVQGCCPVKIVESMAAGTPVMASNLKVCRELIKHGENGVLVEPGSPRAWALEIRRAARDKSRLEKMSEAAKKTALSRFDRQSIHDSLIACLKRAASDQGVPPSANQAPFIGGEGAAGPAMER